MKSWTIKFNGGALAILCSNCSKIIKTGIDFNRKELEAVEKGKSLLAYYCKECTTKFKVFKSRRDKERYFELQDNGDYLIWGESYYIRSGGINTIDYIDFESGPFISVGLDIECFGLKGVIKEIIPELSSDKPNCYRLILQ